MPLSKLKTKAMSFAFVVALCFVCFLNNVAPITRNTTLRYSNYKVDLIGTCLRNCKSLSAELERTKSKMNPADERVI